MKKIIIAVLLIGGLCAGAQTTTSQDIQLPALDKSPMDMSFYPTNYPVLKIQNKITEPLVARVIYSRPQKDNRTIFGELVEYNTVWRMGANEATEIEFFKEVKVGGKKLAKGRYSMYAIPTPSQWTIIFNKETDTWGAFKYDAKKDALRVTTPSQKITEVTEAFTINFIKSTTGADLIIAWDTTLVKLPISFK